MAEARGFIVSAWDEFRARERPHAFHGAARGWPQLRRPAREPRTGPIRGARSGGPGLRRDRHRGRVPRGLERHGRRRPRPPLPAGRGLLRAAERSLAAAGIAVAGLDRRRADEEARGPRDKGAGSHPRRGEAGQARRRRIRGARLRERCFGFSARPALVGPRYRDRSRRGRRRRLPRRKGKA